MNALEQKFRDYIRDAEYELSILYRLQATLTGKAAQGLSKHYQKIEAKRLEKYYTKSEVAAFCHVHFARFIDADTTLIEPAAGAGAFMRPNMLGFDIAPDRADIIKLDFLKDDLAPFLPRGRKIACIGNPPFGRGKTASAFINKCLEYGDTVGFILPVSFRKARYQNRIRQDARLVLDVDLPRDAFTLCGRNVEVQCCFQIWKAGRATDFAMPDLRIRDQPPSKHSDFEMCAANGGYMSKKFASNMWNFATVSGSFQSRSDAFMQRIFDLKDFDANFKWLAFYSPNPVVIERLKSIDFDGLARRALRTCNRMRIAFSQADVVAEYSKRWPAAQ